MSIATFPTRPIASQPVRTGLNAKWHNVIALTRRNIIHISREPLQLSDVTVQPILFTLLFVFVFGSGVPIPGGYANFAIAGLMLMNLTTSAMGTAVGLSSDLTTGAIDRFRTLPMWRSAVLLGRSISDVLSAALCIVIVALTGLVVGWRPDAGMLSILGGLAIPHESQIERSIQQGRNLRVRRQFPEPELHAGITPAVCFNGGREVGKHDGATEAHGQSAFFSAPEAADLLLKGLNGAIGSKKVTYDFARQMDGATEIKCSEFGDNIITHM